MITLQIAGFPVNFTSDQVLRILEPFGSVQAIRLNGEGGSFEVDMADPESAEAAQSLLEGLAFGDRPLHLTRREGRSYSAVA